MKPNLLVSFSGGRTSGYMTKMILDKLWRKYHIQVVFANTGQEHEKTLEFVHNCDRYFGFNTTWVEAVVHLGIRKQPTHKLVSFETASRDGEPFRAVIEKYGVPNRAFPHCSGNLKRKVIEGFIKSIGWKRGYSTAIGIRTDESRRVVARATRDHIVYPLIDWFPADKVEVNDWWEDQEFNLELSGEHQGNCTWCWKKSFGKHARNLLENPQFYDFPLRMEAEYGWNGPPENKTHPRVFFRGNRSTLNVTELARTTRPWSPATGSEDQDSGCSESCEIYPTR